MLSVLSLSGNDNDPVVLPRGIDSDVGKVLIKSYENSRFCPAMIVDGTVGGSRQPLLMNRMSIVSICAQRDGEIFRKVLVNLESYQTASFGIWRVRSRASSAA